MKPFRCRLIGTFVFVIAWSSIALAPPAQAGGIPVFDGTALGRAVIAFQQAQRQLVVVTQTLAQVRAVVNQGKEMLRIIGDPASLLRELGFGDILTLMSSVMELNNLGRMSFAQICSLADETKSLTSAKLNPFSSGRDLTLLVNGQSRDTGQYRAFAVFEQGFAQFTDVVEKDRKIQADAQKKVAEAVQKLSSATTNADREAARAMLQAAEAAASHSRQQVTASSAMVQASGSAADLGLRKDARLAEETAVLAARAAVAKREQEMDLMEANMFRRAR